MKYDYDVLTIGMGPAGMAVSAMASAMGLKTCAVESRKIGGECMNVGCIPSKALLRMAKTRHTFHKLAEMELGAVPLPPVLKPFQRIQQDLDFISRKKTLKMFEQVELILGQGPAAFVGPHEVEAGSRRISARNIFIAVGTRPSVPEFSGLDKIEYLTNENLFNLEKVPQSLAVIGGGAIACEMAQAFARLGAKVTIVYRGASLLKREDREAAALLEAALRADGVDFVLGETPASFATDQSGILIETQTGRKLACEKVLLALGRRMDFSALDLEQAGIRYSAKGIQVNSALQTSQRHVYAVGDCNGHFQFSHAAMHQGMLALINCMTPRFLKRNFRNYVVPLTIFTEPQISRVGLSEQELNQRKLRYRVVKTKYEDYGAAIAEKVACGFVKVFLSPSARIYGAVVAGEGSSDMINEWGLAVQKRLRIADIMFLQHSFPSMAFLNKRAAETWMMDLMQRNAWLKTICRLAFRL